MQYDSTMIADAAQSAYGFDPFTFHCEATGKPIGRLADDEISGLMSHLFGSTLEEYADDVAMRAMFSMRPSVIWNRMRHESLEIMMRTEPKQTLAFLLNRLFELPVSHPKFNWLTMRHDRIKVWNWLSEQNNQEAMDSTMLMLLEIDAKTNLQNELSAPITCKEMLANHMGYLVDHLQPWHEARIAAYNKAEREAQFFAANPGAKRAFATKWMEAKPKSDKTLKAEANQKEMNFLDSVLRNLMGDEAPMASQRVDAEFVRSALEPKGHIKPVTKMPMRFGVKAVQA